MEEKDLRKYGEAPFNLAVIHGGPGAFGEMKPVAEELQSNRGVLEPFQKVSTIENQVDELKNILEDHGDVPVTLIGYSWGGWLSIIFSSIYPALVEKIILIGCPPFREKYASEIMATRLNRLDETERKKANKLMDDLDKSSPENREETLEGFGGLTRKADAYDPLPSVNDLSEIEIRPEIYRSVWEEAKEVRKSGELLELAELVRAPVVAIHGDYDPHPAEGVKEPLSNALGDFKFILLENCGHTPWLEKMAKDKFYAILKGVLG